MFALLSLQPRADWTNASTKEAWLRSDGRRPCPDLKKPLMSKTTRSYIFRSERVVRKIPPLWEVDTLREVFRGARPIEMFSWKLPGRYKNAKWKSSLSQKLCKNMSRGLTEHTYLYFSLHFDTCKYSRSTTTPNIHISAQMQMQKHVHSSGWDSWSKFQHFNFHDDQFLTL